MFQRALMITAIRKQYHLLNQLLREVEKTKNFNEKECLYCRNRFGVLAKNMTHIRQKHQGYCDDLADSYCDQ